MVKKIFIYGSIIFCLIKCFTYFEIVENNSFITTSYYVFSAIIFLYCLLFNRKLILNKFMFFPILIISLLFFSILINFNFNNIFHIISFCGIFVINFILLNVEEKNDYDEIFKKLEFYLSIIQIISFSIITFILLQYVLYHFGIFDFEHVFWGNEKIKYLAGIVGVPCKFGQLCNMLIGISIFSIFNKKNKLIFNIGCILFSIIGVILTNERAEILFLMISFIIFSILYIFNSKNKIKYIKFFAVIVFSFIIVMILLYKINIINFRPFIDFENMSLDASSNERLILILTGLEVIFNNNFLFGLGPSKFYEEYVGSYYNENSIGYNLNHVLKFLPHNDYIVILGVIGIIGFIVLIIYFLKIFINLFDMFKNKNDKYFPIFYSSIFLVFLPLMTALFNDSAIRNVFLFPNLVMFMMISLINRYGKHT